MIYKYKAFISYKHSDSKEQAKAIEYAIKRYGRSWFSISHRIFRDESVIPPGKNINKEIKEALDNAEYLVYLASPNAAMSQWVQEELSYWCNDLGRSNQLIIVLTGGHIHPLKSDLGQIDWKITDTIPIGIKPYFDFFPYFVDFRLAQGTVIDHKEPRFIDLACHLIARIKGVTPEEIRDGAKRAYRRNIRFRNAAVFALLFLITTSVIAFFLADKSATEAQTQTERATQKEKEAEISKVKAEASQERTLLALSLADSLRQSEALQKEIASKANKEKEEQEQKVNKQRQMNSELNE